MTTNTIQVNETIEWLRKEESAVEAFEVLLMEMVEEMGATVVYDPDCENSGAYYFEGSRIVLPTRLKERTEEDLSQSMVRIMTIGHELGHHLDFTLYYDSDVTDYMETGLVILEQDAWGMGIHVLRDLGFGELGDIAWHVLERFMVKCLSSYYMTQRGLERLEARREAAKIAQRLLKSKEQELTHA